MKTALWAGLALTAVLWPARLVGPLDGAPLDAPLEAVTLGLVFAALMVCEPRVLMRRSFGGVVLALLLWKAATAATLAQDGWCLRFTTPQPVYRDMGLVPHSWDVRADWRSPEPTCSAVMARAYPLIEGFPVWFYNLAPARIGDAPTKADRPPQVSLRLDLEGFLNADRPGLLRVELGEDIRATARLDDDEVTGETLAAGIPLAAGLHRVAIQADLEGSHWSLIPTWSDADLWTATTATLTPPTPLDRWMRPWGRYVPALLIGWLLAIGLLTIARRVNSAFALGYVGAMSSVAILAAVTDRTTLIRAAPAGLLLAVAIRWPRRLQNLFGAFLLVGVPFLAVFVAIGAPQAGLMTWYSGGDDWWTFQRFAYRIFMQGYWLEGGQPTFWYQPLYRWIAGSLHMVFGDSSVGELFWDAACLLTGASFAFHVTRIVAGFRWGVVASVTTLCVFTLGPGWYLIGRGLSEISSVGFIYAACLLALRGRGGSWPAAVAAGAVATLGFYSRLNNLPMVLAVAAFALPVRVTTGDLFRHSAWWPRVSRVVLAGILGTIAIGLCLFTARTWYYTGVVSLLHGTQASTLSVWQATGEGLSPIQQVIGSVLMVLTMNDPPQFDVRAVPIMIGVAASVLALVQVRPFRALPLNLVGLCLAGASGALVARGTAYPGRFSIHLIPVTVALTVSLVARVVDGRRARSSQ